MVQRSVQHKDWKVDSELTSLVIIRTSEIKNKNLRNFRENRRPYFSSHFYHILKSKNQNAVNNNTGLKTQKDTLLVKGKLSIKNPKEILYLPKLPTQGAC